MQKDNQGPIGSLKGREIYVLEVYGLEEPDNPPSLHIFMWNILDKKRQQETNWFLRERSIWHRIAS
jgi:hypothetical protein